MARACKIIGATLSVVGVAIALTFVTVIARDDAYRQAAKAFSLNPGNVMYEAEFKGAQVRRAFELTGVIAGVLLAINGTTLLGLGVVAARVRRK
jgi:hypothetical protein